VTPENRPAVRCPGALDELSTGSLAVSRSHAEIDLAVPKAIEEAITMTSLTAARRELTAASGLAATLNAAYDAFEFLLMIFRDGADPAADVFAAFVMSAALAADGRDAIAFAPSLPPAALHGEIAPAADRQEASANELADLCRDLVTSLERVAETALNPDDRAGCRASVRYARGIHVLLTGGEP